MTLMVLFHRLSWSASPHTRPQPWGHPVPSPRPKRRRRHGYTRSTGVNGCIYGWAGQGKRLWLSQPVLIAGHSPWSHRNAWRGWVNVLCRGSSQGLHTRSFRWVRKLYEPSPVPTLYVGRVEDLLGRVPLFPCFLDGNTTSTIPYKYAGRQKQAFEFGCADGQGPASRRGSHVYEVNDWLWNFGRPQPRVGGLSVSKTERIRRKSRSEASRRSWETRKARKMAADEIW